MNPDESFGALSLIWQDVFGKDGLWRQTDITEAEWQSIEERVRTLRVMNSKKEKNDYGNAGS